MTFLVDTDWVIDYLKGRQRALDLFAGLITEGIAISLISYGEIYEGIYYGGRQQSAELGFTQFLEIATVLSLIQLIMRRFARMRGELRQRGFRVGDSDLLIAATAVEHNLILVTRNLSRILSAYPTWNSINFSEQLALVDCLGS